MKNIFNLVLSKRIIITLSIILFVSSTDMTADTCNKMFVYDYVKVSPAVDDSNYVLVNVMNLWNFRIPKKNEKTFKKQQIALKSKSMLNDNSLMKLSTYYVDLNAGLMNYTRNYGLNIMMGINSFNIGFRFINMPYNQASSGELSSVSEYSIIGGYTFSGKKSFGCLNIGLGVVDGTRTIYSYSNSHSNVDVGTGWGGLLGLLWNLSGTSSSVREDHFSNIGFPWEFKYMFLLGKNVGIGGTLFGNLNSTRSYCGANITLSIGKLK